MQEQKASFQTGPFCMQNQASGQEEKSQYFRAERPDFVVESKANNITGDSNWDVCAIKQFCNMSISSSKSKYEISLLSYKCESDS
eukprot:11180867-Ditylum_brightwellii.AAC.1